jgi:hypothetical protein
MKSMLICLVLFALACTATAKVKSCGAADCPLNRHQYLGAGSLRLGLSYDYINQDGIRVGTTPSPVGAIRGQHDEVQTINEKTTLQAELGLLDQLSIGVELPFVHREHTHIHHDATQDVWERWDFSGLGDVRVTASFVPIVPSADQDAFLSVTAGIKAPTGVTDARNAEGEEAEVTIQPGTGSLDAVVRVNYRQTLATLPAFGGVFATLPLEAGVSYQRNGRGKDNYLSGNVFVAYLGTSYQIARRASVQFQVNARNQGFADVGDTDEPRENTGGTWIFVSPGLGVNLSDALSATAFVQLPVYQDVHGIQQVSSANLSFGLSYALDVLGGD